MGLGLVMYSAPGGSSGLPTFRCRSHREGRDPCVPSAAGARPEAHHSPCALPCAFRLGVVAAAEWAMALAAWCHPRVIGDGLIRSSAGGGPARKAWGQRPGAWHLIAMATISMPSVSGCAARAVVRPRGWFGSLSGWSWTLALGLPPGPVRMTATAMDSGVQGCTSADVRLVTHTRDGRSWTSEEREGRRGVVPQPRGGHGTVIRRNPGTLRGPALTRARGRLRGLCHKARSGEMTSLRGIECQQQASHDKQVTTNHYLCWSTTIAYGQAIPGDP